MTYWVSSPASIECLVVTENGNCKIEKIVA